MQMDPAAADHAERAWQVASGSVVSVEPTWPGYTRPGFGAPPGTAPEGSGVVERVEYAFSQPRSKTDKPVPHTFVTFKIEEIIKGHTENEKALTLRFVGGPYDKARFLLVPQVPLFEIGDREILFVTGNGTRACPLVGWSQGRIQVIGDSVFSDDGREVWLSEKGTMTFGRAHNLKEVQTERIGETVIRRVTVAPTGETPRREGRVALGRRMNHEAFVDYLRNLIRPHLAAQPTLPIIPVKSAQPGQPFEFGITQAPPRGDRLLRRNNEGKAAQ